MDYSFGTWLKMRAVRQISERLCRFSQFAGCTNDAHPTPKLVKNPAAVE
jgi:hypothetical protein